MTRAWVLMTALPPTKGHMNLIRFAASLAREVEVIVCTQPTEPYPMVRWAAVKSAAKKDFGSGVHVHHLHQEMMQDPSIDGFWPTWDNIMKSFGAKPGDLYVSSELYGATLAERLQGEFFPYDPNRELYYTKATNIREHMVDYFHDILPEFQWVVRTNVVIFGAESTGKTTLSKYVAETMDAHWFFEWARPYLEAVGPEITKESMRAIWKGQAALQRHSHYMYDKPFAVFDTDLYSTIGYWEQPHWQDDLGPVPTGLLEDATVSKADLYVITKSNIPFEADPLRYGGDKRESPDEFWIDVAERHNLNYIVLEESDINARLGKTMECARMVAQRKAESLFYDRKGL